MGIKQNSVLLSNTELLTEILKDTTLRETERCETSSFSSKWINRKPQKNSELNQNPRCTHLVAQHCEAQEKSSHVGLTVLLSEISQLFEWCLAWSSLHKAAELAWWPYRSSEVPHLQLLNIFKLLKWAKEQHKGCFKPLSKKKKKKKA